MQHCEAQVLRAKLS